MANSDKDGSYKHYDYDYGHDDHYKFNAYHVIIIMCLQL